MNTLAELDRTINDLGARMQAADRRARSINLGREYYALRDQYAADREQLLMLSCQRAHLANQEMAVEHVAPVFVARRYADGRPALLSDGTRPRYTAGGTIVEIPPATW